MAVKAQHSLPATTLPELRAEIQSLAASLTVEDLRPRADGKWSVAQILEHLYLSYAGTVKGMNRVLEAGKPLARKPTLGERAVMFLITRVGYFPSGRKAPAVATPRGLEASVVQKEIGAQLTAMKDVLDECAGKFGQGTRVLDHPILGPLSVDQWRKLHVAHGRHHLKQIRLRRSDQEQVV